MADTTRVVRIVVDASGAQQGSSQVTSALERIDRQRQRTQSGLQALAAANASASARMIAGMSAVNNASLRMIEGMSRAGQAANLLDRQIGVAANTNRRFGSAIQQAGFQVGDFAVQIASGTNPLRAFVQQGTQLISMFGPWGAIIGAAGAVVGALAMSFLDLEGATDAATSAQERHNELMERAKQLTEELTASTVNLSNARRIEGQNRLALMRQELRDLERLEEERRRAERGQFGSYGDEIAGQEVSVVTEGRPSNARIDQLKREIRDLEVLLWGDQISRGTVPGMQRTVKATKDLGDAADRASPKVRTLGDILADLNQKAIANEAREYADAVRLIERTVESGLTDQQRYQKQIDDLNRALEKAAERGYTLSIEAQQALNRAMREANPAVQAANRAYEEQRRERERLAEQEAELMRRPFENALEGIQDSFTDFFQSVFDGGIDSFRDLASGIKSIFTRLAAEIAALLVFRPVVAGILGGVGLGGIAGGMGLMPTSGGGLPGGVGIGTGSIIDAAGGIGRALAGGFSGLNAWLFGLPAVGGSHPIAATAGLLGSGGTFLGSTFLAEAFLPGLGALLPGLISGNVKQAGLGLGGALLGTAIGGPIGGAIGGILGNLVGDLFGGKKGIPQVTQNLLFQGGQLVPGAPWSANNGGSMVAGTRTLGQSVADAVNQIVADLGGSILEGATGGYVKVKQTGKGTRYFAGLGSYGSGISLGAGDDPQAIAGLVISGILQEAARAGNLTGVSDSVLTVLNQGKVTKGSVRSLEQLNEDIAFAQLYDQLTGIAKPVTQAEQAIKELNKQFADAKRRAEDLGLAVGPLVEAQAKAIEKLTTDFNASIQDQILAITNPTALALKQLEEAQRARLEEAKKLGADLVEVERLSALERKRVLETSGLRSFFDEITFGGLSGASPGASLEGARAAFEAAAASGDIAGIQTYGRAYLETARAFHASGAGFQDALARVQNVVGSHLAANSNMSVVSAVNDVGSLIAASNNLLAQLRAEMSALREENRELREQMLALAS
ncbi:MAG TPA: phage tail length tape measure family protein [Hyphomicrobiaceae bacterium]